MLIQVIPFFLLVVVELGSSGLAFHCAVPSLRQPTRLFQDYDAPSDYDSQDLQPADRPVYVDENNDDEAIRDALKRELLLLSSVTSRGEYSTSEERDLVIDIVTQLGKSFAAK